MANRITPFLNNLVQGALNPKGNLGDYAHGARLYVDDAFRLAPKVKFLYHVTFNINTEASSVIPQLAQKHRNEINMLVKSADLPKYDISTDVKHQYNRKRVVQKRIDYAPITIRFHDDNQGVTTAMWEAYYRYYYKDGNYGGVDAAGSPDTSKKDPYDKFNAFKKDFKYRYGFDNDSSKSFFDSIVIYQMARQEYTSFTLVNPMISSWSHDTMDQAVSEVVESQMQLQYETVWYSRGKVVEGVAPKGFASEHYDLTPSPLSLAGGGATRLFGQGGIAAGAQSVFGDLAGNTVDLNTILTAGNVIRNTKNLSKDGIRQESFGILKDAIGESAGIDVSGVANTVFPKNGGSGGLTSETKAVIGVGAVAAVSKLAEKFPNVSDATTYLNNNETALNDVTKATTFKAQHLANGGSANMNDINTAYEALSDTQKANLNATTINDLPNILNSNSGVTV
tara:strand:+ start:604 stop:1959 length:1356 start_codon:yes stop_codon:yes gene_type:complete